MRYYSNPGSRIKPIREAIMKDGKIEVIQTGVEDIQDYIDSFKDECDINILVSRALNGEPEILNKVAGQYVDCIGLPKTLAEAYEKVDSARQFFEGLSKDKQVEYGGTFEGFINDFETFDFTSPNDVVVDEKDSEVTE